MAMEMVIMTIMATIIAITVKIKVQITNSNEIKINLSSKELRKEGAWRLKDQLESWSFKLSNK